MPQAKTKNLAKSQKQIELKGIPETPTSRDNRGLVGTLHDYEDSLRKQGHSNCSDRFSMLTASERDYIRAELVADFIRLSVGNMGNTPVYYKSAIKKFCAKICEMEVPSFELIGTYFAALSAADTEEILKNSPKIKDAIRKTIPEALQMCVDITKKQSRRKLSVSTSS